LPRCRDLASLVGHRAAAQSRRTVCIDAGRSFQTENGRKTLFAARKKPDDPGSKKKAGMTKAGMKEAAATGPAVPAGSRAARH
jgi:hypothetical protein